MKTKWFAISALALSLGAVTGTTADKAYATGTPAAGFQEGRWDEPPSEYRDVQRQGYHDGVEAARRDFEGHRHKDADDHGEYRHPRVEHALVNDYRDAFKSGYSRAMHHMRDEEHHDHN